MSDDTSEQLSLDKIVDERMEDDDDPTLESDRTETSIGVMPTDWGVDRLSEISEINPDGFSEDEWEGETFEYISLSEVSEGEILGSETVPVDEAPSRAQREIKAGDVLVGTVRPKQVSHGLVTEEYDGKICSSGFGVLRTGEDLNGFYLLQEVLSHRFFRQMEAYVAGGAYPAVKIGDLEKHRIGIPSPHEQRKIASVLCNIDEAIQKTNEIIRQKERVKKGLMQDIFRYGIDSDSIQRNPDEEAPYQETKYGPAPNAWDIVPLNSIVSDDAPITYGIVKPGDHYPGGVPIVKVEDIINGEIETGDLLHTDPEIHEKYNRAELNEGDLLFTIRGTVGRMAFVPESLEGANITQDTARIRVEEANPRFIRYYLETYTPNNYFERHTKGQAVQGINLEDLREVPVHLPPEDEQERIVNIVDNFTEQIRTEREQLEKFERLKQGLMQDLLSGEVRTADREIDVLPEVEKHG